MEIWDEICLDREKGARRLVAEFGDRLFGAALVVCRERHAAEDLVFKTLAQAVAKIGQYDPAKPFWNWIYTIMLNFFRMDMRKHRDMVPEDPDFVSAKIESDSCLFSENLLNGIDAGLLREAISRLPTAMRETVMLHYFEGRSVQEMAELMSVPEGTVKWRIHKARVVLAKTLDACFGNKETERRKDDDKRTDGTGV